VETYTNFNTFAPRHLTPQFLVEEGGHNAQKKPFLCVMAHPKYAYILLDSWFYH
jgi:hypothetical protein